MIKKRTRQIDYIASSSTTLHQPRK